MEEIKNNINQHNHEKILYHNPVCRSGIDCHRGGAYTHTLRRQGSLLKPLLFPIPCLTRGSMSMKKEDFQIFAERLADFKIEHTFTEYSFNSLVQGIASVETHGYKLMSEGNKNGEKMIKFEESWKLS